MTFSDRDFINDLCADGSTAYLLLDGAQFENLPAIIYQHEHTPSMKSLFLGTYYESVMEAGPYLVHVSEASPILRWFMYEGTALSAGIALKSSSEFDILYAHLQKWCEVILPNYNIAVFRYYDPVVCAELMQNMSIGEKKTLLENIDALYWPVGNVEDDQARWNSVHYNNL